ncbi:MAG TPA: ADOP family duplicated permease [Gemmatimonadaceae bacterium]|nr:ADOP family duplicated permease [Gemmatimonadaceae bacterium]
MLDAARHDLRFAMRSLRRSPGFVVTAVLSLALAIGASASAFSVVDAIRYRALPFADADRLVIVTELPTTGGASGAAPVAPASCTAACDVSYLTYATILKGFPFRSLDGVVAFQSGLKGLTRKGDVEPVLGTVASPGVFPLLRVAPERGRFFTADDDRLGAEPVAILSHDLWVTRFGADPAILGTPVQLSDTRYTVIGIAPSGFAFETASRFWIPIVPALDPATRPSIRTATVVGRLAAGATIEQLRAELATIEPVASPRLSGAPPGRTRLDAEPLRDRYTTASQGRDVIFAVIVACVLLIACGNLASLVLVRAIDQQRELAVRSALGAGAGRLVRTIVTQNVVLAGAGAVGGLAFATWFISVLRTVPALNTFRPAGLDYRVDTRVAAFAIAIAVVAAALTSLVPAALVRSGRLHDTLREGTQTGGRGAGFARRAFVTLQVACAAALLIGAGLEVRTVTRVSRTDLGFDTTHLAVGAPSYPHDWRVPAMYVPVTRRIHAEARTLPGVVSASIRASTPLGTGRAAASFTPQGRAAPVPAADAPTLALAVSPEYFETVNVPVLRGRAFTDDDRAETMRVAIINEWAAARWWPGADPVGQRMRVDTAAGALPLDLTIVGVARNNRAARPSLTVSADVPELYVPYEQAPSPFPSFIVRTGGLPADVMRPFRALLVREVPARPVSTQLVADQVAQQLGGIRTTASEVLAFAAIGLLLAVVGVYGVVAYSVARRAREIGIRRALGAPDGSLHGLVLREAMTLAMTGFAGGAAGAFAGANLMAPLLYGTSPRDAAVYLSIGALILTVTAAAAVIPARRAARIDPASALRAT